MESLLAGFKEARSISERKSVEGNNACPTICLPIVYGYDQTKSTQIKKTKEDKLTKRKALQIQELQTLSGNFSFPHYRACRHTSNCYSNYGFHSFISFSLLAVQIYSYLIVVT